MKGGFWGGKRIFELETIFFFGRELRRVFKKTTKCWGKKQPGGKLGIYKNFFRIWKRKKTSARGGGWKSWGEQGCEKKTSISQKKSTNCFHRGPMSLGFGYKGFGLKRRGWSLPRYEGKSYGGTVLTSRPGAARERFTWGPPAPEYHRKYWDIPREGKPGSRWYTWPWSLSAAETLPPQTYPPSYPPPKKTPRRIFPPPKIEKGQKKPLSRNRFCVSLTEKKCLGEKMGDELFSPLKKTWWLFFWIWKKKEQILPNAKTTKPNEKS